MIVPGNGIPLSLWASTVPTAPKSANISVNATSAMACGPPKTVFLILFIVVSLLANRRRQLAAVSPSAQN
jgi:hypothetical protein